MKDEVKRRAKRLSETSLEVSGFKCFDDFAGFERIQRMNLVIGKNNSGKSALLDLIEALVSGTAILDAATRAGKSAQIRVRQALSEQALRNTFPKNTHGGSVPGNNHWEFGCQWVGKPFSYVRSGKDRSFLQVEPPFNLQDSEDYLRSLSSNVEEPFNGMKTSRLSSERDINSEGQSKDFHLSSTGRGATNVLRRILLTKEHSNDELRRKIIEGFNEVLGPSVVLEDITLKHDEGTELWEVYLNERGKGAIPLSASGSGLKTILLVLCHLFIVPAISAKCAADYIFLFEELENNLHPDMQRRLLNLINRFSQETGCLIFMTTHSSVCIDMFHKEDDVQFLHVTQHGNVSSVESVSSSSSRYRLLDDLGVRASDLLQANAVIWVEGPSDRTYINHWISLASGNSLKESVHYQCVFYGGKLLSHLSASDPITDDDAFVKLLSVNRNCIVIMDSDIKQAGGEINETKARVLKEVKGMGGYGWVTSGREIENYIPGSVLEKVLSGEKVQLGEKWESVWDAIDATTPGLGEKLSKQKPQFAAEIVKNMTSLGSLSVDLNERIVEIVQHLRAWNGIGATE